MHPSAQRPSTPWRSAQIVSVEAFNRARSLRTVAADPGAPNETYPWAYAFPRPQAASPACQATSQRP